MKPCNYISESIVLVKPLTGASYKAKLVTEYGRDASGGLIVVSTRYVDTNNAVVTLNVTDAVEVIEIGQPVTAQEKCVITTEQAACDNGVNLRMVTEYGFDSEGGLIVVSTRFVNAENEVVVATAPVYGECPKAIFSDGIVCYDVGGVVYSAQTLNGVTTWTDVNNNPVDEPDLTNADLTCCPECVTPCVDYYSEVHTLAAGTTVIPHNLNLSDPNAFLIELWSETDGDFVHPQITATTADSITLTSTVEATNIRVTVKAAEGCRGLADPGTGGADIAVSDEGVQVEAATTSLNFTGNVTATSDGAGNVTVDVPSPPSYAQVVYTNTADPNTGTIFDLVNPPATNNPALEDDPANLYIGSDGSTWVWNGTAYVTKVVPTATEWDYFGTSTDAGSNKTSIIQRYADTVINGVRVGRGGGNLQSNTLIGGGGAFLSNTTGDNNVALGEYALASNTTGSSNFGMGFASLGNNKTGSFNVGLGRATLRWSLGNYNNAFGMQSFSGAGLTGSENVGMGWLSGSNSTGNSSFNTFIGSRAGELNTTGGNNTVIGSRANVPSNTASNQASIKNSIFGINLTSTNPFVPAGSWGVNAPAPLSTWDVNGSFGANIRANGNSTSFTADDHTVVLLTTGTSATLPTPVNRRIVVVKNASAGTSFVAGNIDGATATLPIPAGGSRTLQSNGTTWYIIGGYL